MTLKEGILKTTVTWAQFETLLRVAFGTEARLGSSKSELDIGDGNGFASCCGLISCDWVSAAAEERLPKTVVIKIPSFLPMKRMNEALAPGQKMFDYNDEEWEKMQGEFDEIHNVEVASYEFLNEFDGLSVPKMFFGEKSKESEAGLICLEYVENTRMMQFYEKHSVEQVKQIARSLGKIQACSLKKEPASAELQSDFWNIQATTWPMETFQGMFEGLKAVDSSEKTSELMGNIEKVLKPAFYETKLASTIHDQMGFRRVLVNGDLHTGNVLLNRESGDLAALIDWQCAHLGVGVEDLHRIAMSALTSSERRASMPTLIGEMYGSLVKHLNGAEPPYTLETLLILSDLLYPQCALLLASSCFPIITKLDTDAAVSDEERAARKDVMMDKVLGSLEDVLKVIDINKKQIENLKLRIS